MQGADLNRLFRIINPRYIEYPVVGPFNRYVL